MRAVQIPHAGGPEVLSLVEVDPPRPGPGEVQIEVRAAGVNFIDTYQRGGLYPMEFPFVAGLEAAGTISALGEGVDGFAVGDRVAVGQGNGSYAEVRTAPADRVVPIPDGVDFEQGAAAMIQGMTAHYLTHDTYPLGPGDRCLIHAGAGGTGRLLIQMAKARGAEVFSTAGSEEKLAIVSDLGADHAINYSETDFADEIRSITGDEKPLDVVYDGVGAAVFDKSLGLLRTRGLMATFGNASGAVEPVSPLALSSGGSLFLTRPTLFDYVATSEELHARAHDVFAMIGDGTLDILIGGTYALEDAEQAHRDLEGRATIGKLLLVPK